MNPHRNPVYDHPDAHELEVQAALAGRAHIFHLVESSREARRARASYWHRKAARTLVQAAKPD